MAVTRASSAARQSNDSGQTERSRTRTSPNPRGSEILVRTRNERATTAARQNPDLEVEVPGEVQDNDPPGEPRASAVPSRSRRVGATEESNEEPTSELGRSDGEAQKDHQDDRLEDFRESLAQMAKAITYLAQEKQSQNKRDRPSSSSSSSHASGEPDSQRSDSDPEDRDKEEDERLPRDRSDRE